MQFHRELGTEHRLVTLTTRQFFWLVEHKKEILQNFWELSAFSWTQQYLSQELLEGDSFSLHDSEGQFDKTVNVYLQHFFVCLFFNCMKI